MSRFWFSRRNLNRTISNIMTLFGAVDSDLDEVEASLQSLDDRVSQIDGGGGDDTIEYRIYDPITDSAYNMITDEQEDPILSGKQAVAILEKAVVEAASEQTGS